MITRQSSLFIIIGLLYLVLSTFGQLHEPNTEFTAFSYSLDSTDLVLAGYFFINNDLPKRNYISYQFTPLEDHPNYVPTDCHLQIYLDKTIYAQAKVDFSIAGDEPVSSPFVWEVPPTIGQRVYFTLTLRFMKPLGFFVDSAPIGQFIHHMYLDQEMGGKRYLSVSRYAAIAQPIVPLASVVKEYQPESHIKLNMACTNDEGAPTSKCGKVTPFTIVAHNIQMTTDTFGEYEDPQLTLSFYGPLLQPDAQASGKCTCLLNGVELVLNLVDHDEFVTPEFPLITYRSETIPENFLKEKILQHNGDLLLRCANIGVSIPKDNNGDLLPFSQVVHLTLGDASIYVDNPSFALRPSHTFHITRETLRPSTYVAIDASINPIALGAPTVADDTLHGFPLNPVVATVSLNYYTKPLPDDTMTVCLSHMEVPRNEPVYVTAVYSQKNKKGVLERYQLYKQSLTFTDPTTNEMKNPPCIDILLFADAPKNLRPQVFDVYLSFLMQPRITAPSMFVHVRSHLVNFYLTTQPRVMSNLVSSQSPLHADINYHANRDYDRSLVDIIERQLAGDAVGLTLQDIYADDTEQNEDVDTGAALMMGSLSDPISFYHTNYSPESTLKQYEYSAPLLLQGQPLSPPKLNISPSLMIVSLEGPHGIQGDKGTMKCTFTNLDTNDVIEIQPTMMNADTPNPHLLFVFKSEMGELGTSIQFTCDKVYAFARSHTELNALSILTVTAFNSNDISVPYVTSYVYIVDDAQKSRDPSKDSDRGDDILVELSCSDFSVTTKPINGNEALVWMQDFTQHLTGRSSTLLVSLRGIPKGTTNRTLLGSATLDLMALDLSSDALHPITLTGLQDGTVKGIGVVNMRITLGQPNLPSSSAPFAYSAPSAPELGTAIGAPQPSYYDTPQLDANKSLGPPKYEEHIEFQSIGIGRPGGGGAGAPPSDGKGYDAPPSYDFYATPAPAGGSGVAAGDGTSPVIISQQPLPFIPKQYSTTDLGSIDIRILLNYSRYLGFPNASTKILFNQKASPNPDKGLEYDPDHMHIQAKVSQPTLSLQQRLEDRRIGELDKARHEVRHQHLSNPIYPHIAEGAPRRVSVFYDPASHGITCILIHYAKAMLTYGVLPPGADPYSIECTFTAPGKKMIVGMRVHYNQIMKTICGLSICTCDGERSRVYGNEGSLTEDVYFIEKSSGTYGSLTYFECYTNNGVVCGLRAFYSQPVLFGELLPGNVDPSTIVRPRRDSVDMLHPTAAPVVAVDPNKVSLRELDANRSSYYALLVPTTTNLAVYIVFALLCYLYIPEAQNAFDGQCSGSKQEGFVIGLMNFTFGAHIVGAAFYLVWIALASFFYMYNGGGMKYTSRSRNGFLWIYFIFISALAILGIVGLARMTKGELKCLPTSIKVITLLIYSLSLLNVLGGLIALIPSEGASTHHFALSFVVQYGVVVAAAIALVVCALVLLGSANSSSRSRRRGRRY